MTSGCVDDCRRPTPAQAHCPSCHRTFGGVTGFDHHRRDGRCLDPAARGYQLMAGIWRQPMPESTRDAFAHHPEES